jgi:hypothetical protein
MKKTALWVLALALLWACSPDRDDDIQIDGNPAAAVLSWEWVANDSNRVVVRDLTPGSFQRLWDLPGAGNKTSTKALDTVFYSKAGEYTITLYSSVSDGRGSSYTSVKIKVVKDAPLSCTPKYAMLTGDCGAGGKCWTFNKAAASLKVGPTYEDYSWYTAPANGLQGAQYDDGFCFTFENLVYQNKNNGATVNPWNGYMAEAYNPGVSEFVFSEGTGTGGRDQIILPNNQFMGVWDCDNVLDVVKLTDTELVVRGRQCEQNGTPKPEGWFELHFVPQ